MDLDINALRSITTLASFVLFIGIMVWAYSKRREADFTEAANLPFEQD
jgi:cytochrome c oxidase cbb3-type subunit 4